MSTQFEKNIDQNNKSWYLFDASEQVVGRLATKIADILRGKHKPSYTPHVDSGDFVVVVNAEKIKFTGNKWADKKYYDHTGFMGGLKTKTAKDLLQRNPERIIQDAVWGMLNKGKLGRQQYTKLKVYRGSEHPHVAQNPKSTQLETKTKK